MKTTREGSRLAITARGSRRTFAITMCVATALLVAGAGIAVAGSAAPAATKAAAATGPVSSGGATAASAQYGLAPSGPKDKVGAGSSTIPSDPGAASGVKAATAATASDPQTVDALNSNGNLPFTGSPTDLLLGLGFVLLLAGMVLRQRTRSRSFA